MKINRVEKFLLILIAMAFAVSIFTDCRAKKETVSSVSATKDSSSIIQTLNKDSVRAKADSTKLHVELGCDSLNRVIIKLLGEKKTEGVSTNFNFDNGVLDYSTERPEKVFILYSVNKTSTKFFDNKVKTTETLYVNYMTWFQKVFFWIGVFCSGVFCGWVALKLYTKFR